MRGVWGELLTIEKRGFEHIGVVEEVLCIGEWVKGYDYIKLSGFDSRGNFLGIL